MKISVTQEDIDNGATRGPRSVTHCMCALAIRRAFPEAGFLTVGFSTASVDGVIYDLPDPVADRIHAFANGEPVEPFEFELPDARR